MNNPREKLPEADCQLFVLTKDHPKKALPAGFGTGSPGFFRMGSELPVDEILFWAETAEALEKKSLTHFCRHHETGAPALAEHHEPATLRAEPTGKMLSDTFAPLSGEAFRLAGPDGYSDAGVTSRAEWERLHGPVTLAMPTEKDAARPLKLWPFPGCNRTTWTPTTENAYDQLLDGVPPVWMGARAFIAGEPHSHDDFGRPVYSCFVKTEHGIFCRHLTVEEFRTCRAA